jgi:hypothetical protein
MPREAIITTPAMSQRMVPEASIGVLALPCKRGIAGD